MLRVLILADDLSGAADCGAAFTGAGLSAIVALNDLGAEVHAEVLSIDLHTRSMKAGSAAEQTARLVRKYAHDRDLLLFKKIDSTLRGHVGVELVAALDAYRSLHAHSGRATAVFAPAFPSIGRSTIDGFQLAHGRPLHEMEIWRLQGLSHRSYIPHMLHSVGLKSALLPLEIVRSAQRMLVETMRLSANDADVLVCDAETEADLEAIARASVALESRMIWVGSAGLAYHLPAAAGLTTAAVPDEIRLPPLTGPLLFIIGSLSGKSNEQVRLLSSTSETLRISVPPGVLLVGEESPHWQEYERALVEAVEHNRDVVLGAGTEFQVKMSERPLLSAALARMTFRVRAKVGALIAAGGETARTVLQSWGVTGLRLVGELGRGVPVSVTEDWTRRLLVITKAGDFGKPETLLHCSAFLHSAVRNLNWHRIRGKVRL
jgi:uncharacterized protein YgbK (DUF1537 family)